MIRINNKEKIGEVRFDFINDNEALLYFFSRHANSEEAGKVTTCADKDFKAGNSKVGGFGIYACGRLIGATSYEITYSKLNPGKVTGKLDLVSSIPEVRGQGIGSILMASLFIRLAHFFGDDLCQLSTTAVHPSVAHFVSSLGFTTANPESEGPLYTLDLMDPADFANFIKKCEFKLYDNISKIRLNCIRCMSFVHPKKPWCI